MNMAKHTVKTSKTGAPADTKLEGIKVTIQPTTAPLLPHERDQSTAHQANPVDPMMKQAAKDVARGLTDTDRGEEANRVYQKLKLKR